jgi:hypothetical protein
MNADAPEKETALEMVERREPVRPEMSLEQAQATVATKEHPRVTKESIEGRIAEVTYYNHRHLTLCVITMQNGFMSVGQAAPADVRNFDPLVGKRYAYEDAFKKLWPLEGYLLCERLHAAEIAASVTLSN